MSTRTRRPERSTTAVLDVVVTEEHDRAHGVTLYWYATPADATADRPLVSANRAAFTTHRPGPDATLFLPLVERVHTMIRDAAPGARPWHALITHRRGLWGHLHPMADVEGAPPVVEP